MNDAPQKATLVTGASDGIGAALARHFAAQGHRVVLIARRRALLEAVATEIIGAGAAHAPLVVALDLVEAGAVDRLQTALSEADVAVDYLVNNAGFGLMGEIAALDEKEQIEIIDLNTRALTELTLRFLPQIIAAKGGVLNVASVASFAPGPGMGVYYASKAYVRSFSEALAQEMKTRGVNVSCLCPGPVVTGFQARAGFSLSGSLSVAQPALVSPEEVARQAYAGLMANRRVVIPGAANRALVALLALTPNALVLPLLAFAQKRR
jgi:uncharacterized protein